MLHPENLSPCTKENAAERGRLGGLANDPARVGFKHRKWCDKGCTYYDRCPAISTSQGSEKVKNKYPCFIKKQPKEVQNYFESLFMDGEEGLIKVIMDLHFRLMLKTQSAKISAKELREAIEISLATKKGIYGDKDQGNQTVVNVIISNQVDV